LGDGKGKIYIYRVAPNNKADQACHWEENWLDGSPEPAQTLDNGESAIQIITYSHDQQWLAVGDEDGKITVWQGTDDGKRKVAFTFQHADAVHTLAFSSDNRWLVSGSADQTARVWDLNGEKRTTYEVIRLPHLGPINSVAFSQYDTRLLTTSGNNAFVWDFAAVLADTKIPADGLVAETCRRLSVFGTKVQIENINVNYEKLCQ
jgi:WD40 repeat protein